MVTDEVGHLDSAAALLGLIVGLGLDFVFRIPDIQEQDVEVQDGVGRDDVTWATGRDMQPHHSKQALSSGVFIC